MFPHVQCRLSLIGARLARISPSFSVVGAALPLVDEVFPVNGCAQAEFMACAPGLATGPPRDPGCHLRSVVKTELSADPLQVALYGALGYEKTRGNSTVGQAFSYETSDLLLS